MIVYSILNQHNGKRYIGFTSQGLNRRRSSHLSKLRRNRHDNLHLQRAWNRGDRYLLWTILEVCHSLEEVKLSEVKWIAHYNTTNRSIGYNLTQGGDGCIPTEETRMKISVAGRGRTMPPRKPEHTAKIAAAHRGKKLTPEHIDSIVASRLGKSHSLESRSKMSTGRMGIVPWNKGKKLSPEHRARIGASNRGRL